MSAGERGDDVGHFLTGPAHLDWQWKEGNNIGVDELVISIEKPLRQPTGYNAVGPVALELSKSRHKQLLTSVAERGAIVDEIAAWGWSDSRKRKHRPLSELHDIRALDLDILLEAADKALGGQLSSFPRVRIYSVADAFSHIGKLVFKAPSAYTSGDPTAKNPVLGPCFRNAVFQARPQLQRAIAPLLGRLEKATRGGDDGRDRVVPWVALHVRSGYVDAAAHWQRPSITDVPPPDPVSGSPPGLPYGIDLIDQFFADGFAQGGMKLMGGQVPTTPAADSADLKGNTSVFSLKAYSRAASSEASTALQGRPRAAFLSMDSPTALAAMKVHVGQWPMIDAVESMEGHRGHSGFAATLQESAGPQNVWDGFGFGDVKAPEAAGLAVADWYIISLSHWASHMLGTSFTKSSLSRSIIKGQDRSWSFSPDSFTKVVRFAFSLLSGCPTCLLVAIMSC